MCNQKCFMVTGENLRFLCAVLNSSLITWFVKQTAVTTGMGLTQWDKFTVESVPIILPDCSNVQELRTLVKSMLAAISAEDSHEAKKLQRTIDQKIFALYELQPAEIKCVSRW